jgi:predicted NACHT family NTPase
MAKNTRSLHASQAGLQLVREAFLIRGWTQEGLAVRMNCSRHTVSKFLGGKPIDKQNFMLACQELGLSWQTIADLYTSDNLPESSVALDDLVQNIRGKVRKDIQMRCGKIRVLDMEQPIESNDIYTDVYILEKIAGRSRLQFAELLAGFQDGDFDRFEIGKIQERLPGLDAVNKYSKLMILGKLGAGKTTFMKRLAMLCCDGIFQKQRVPIFITLKDFAEFEGKPGILEYIDRQWSSCGITESAKTLLSEGYAMVLLDGLDEVRDVDHDRILKIIRNFTHQYRECSIVITCRIAAQEYIFDNFTEVEIADFSAEQITDFVDKWFMSKGDSLKAKLMIRKLREQPLMQELATTPLLLTLFCLIFEEGSNFPSNRSELYKECLDILLKKWDAQRNIERDQVYKKLSLKRKEDLLSQLAFGTFDKGELFFKQSTAEHYIINYIRSIPGTSDDDFQLDSEAVFQSIIAQQGLLVERAKGVFSFSHLTFHEYFTAKYCANYLISDFSGLLIHLTNRFWREIFLLTVEMLNDAGPLLIAMKNKIDKLSLHDDRMQQHKYASQLLTDCLNSDCYINQADREKISGI